ncbi:GDSL-type esterase/lipase family protein [Clostridium sp.]|uniref:SGNH/GDSL hydrolase family protein n=1 Tax=Clostridium sp. TaxID=1506 RepID=UPI00284D70BD|nr:GDSL-type esterase/lipase family protein [Clostridium sp.]MDR3597320.1 GDSL-type esterase/lipase family protein [Clostridium sp.]
MKLNIKANNENVRILGRTKIIDDIRYINYSCSGIEFVFTGTEASVLLCTDGSKWDEMLKAWVAVFIDDELVPSKRFLLDCDEKVYNLFESTEPRTVKIKLMKMSEAAFAKVGIKEIILNGKDVQPTESKNRSIEFIGDSITCGYGNEGVWEVDTFNTAQENPWEAYAAKTARYFNADFNCVSWSGIGIISSWTEVDTPNTEWLMPMLYKYTDAGIDQDFKKTEYELWNNNLFIPQVIVINLGTNDASYTKNIKERLDEFTDGYHKLLKQVRHCNPNAEIICSLGAMGQNLCPSVEEAVLAFKNETHDLKIHTMRFDVQLETDGIGSDWHPSLKTHDKMSKQLISKINEVTGW